MTAGCFCGSPAAAWATPATGRSRCSTPSRGRAFIGTTTESGPRCARYQGAYVERVADGRLLHVLSHGVGVSHAIAARGRLVAIGGRSEGLTLDGKPDSAQPNFVSLWDAIAGERLANLAFPPGDFSVRALLFSADVRRLYAFVASPSQTQLYVWYLAPEWSALGTK